MKSTDGAPVTLLASSRPRPLVRVGVRGRLFSHLNDHHRPPRGLLAATEHAGPGCSLQPAVSASGALRET
jgi:hypothetical protein